VRGLTEDVDEEMLVHFFRNNGVKAIRAKMPRDPNGNPLCYAFVLTLNDLEKQKALALSRRLTLQNSLVYIEESRSGQQRR
jgi:RNA recognition motif-containing protein